ncbi:MAG TPA: Ulp1 family isopeptidase [Candidatus Megaira endosymbiont of Nemacystus decipiens]|nr:Ulp1 family isopeptidase [Candidatus Megaera endosymbiont of Nemacystus decipiens]
MKNSYESEKLKLVEDLELYDFSKYLANGESKILSTEKNSYANINKHLTGTLLKSAKNQAIFIEDDGHWVGLYVDVKSNKITFIDTLGHDLKRWYSTINNAINDSLKQKGMPKFEVEQLLTRDHRIQYDTNNCGRFVAASMIAFDKGWKKEDFYLSDKQPKSMRQKASGDFATELHNILFAQQDKSMPYQKANKVIKSLENFRNAVNGKNQQQEVHVQKQKISPNIKKESENVVHSVIKQETDITKEKENVERFVKQLDELGSYIEKAKEKKKKSQKYHLKKI